MGRGVVGPGASGVGSKVWVLTIGILEVNPELDSRSAETREARFLVDLLYLVDLSI